MAKKEINSDINVDGQIMLTNVPNGTGNFLTYNLVNKVISQRTNAEVISDLGLITATNIASAYYTKTESDTKFVPYTGANQTINLNTQSLIAGNTTLNQLKYTRAINVSNTDLNNLTFAGFYDGENLTNAPNSGWFYITVERYNDNNGWVKQTVTSFGSGNIGNKTYQRVNIGGTWSSWDEVVFQSWVNTNFIPKTHPVYNITQNNINQWDAAYNWGNHANAGYALSGWVVSNYQSLNNNLTGISNLNLTNSSVGLLKKIAGPPGSNNWTLDTSVYATQTWVTNQGYITANDVPPVYNGRINYTGVGAIEGGGASTANQSVNTHYSFDLTQVTKDNINKGVTAYGWGDHASAGYALASGTINYIPKFTASGTIGNSLIYDNGTNVGIGTTSPTEKLDVDGRIKSKAIVLQENSEALPYQITYENRKFYGTDSTGGKRMFQFADYQAWLDTVNGMTDAQKNEWKTAMNGGWTTNTMSVGSVSPKVVKNSNLPTYIKVEGANLNLNPTNFSLKLVDAITGIETVVPNSQVQLQTNGLSLIFWYNFSTLAISDYYIRLDNGVAILTTNSTSSIMVRDTVQDIDLSLLTWGKVCVTPAEIDNTLITGANSFIFRQNANNTPLVDNNTSVIAAAKSSQILSIGDNLVINGNIEIKAQNGVYNGFILGLAKSSISTQLIDITEASIGFTTDGSNWLNISRIVNKVKSALPPISLTSSTNLNLGFTFVKQGNIASITWRYTDQYNNTTSDTVNKTITDTNYSLYLFGTSGNISGDNTIIINDIYKF